MRRFDRRALLAMTGSAAAISFLPNSAATPRVLARGPISRPPGARMKLSLSAYSLRDFFRLPPGESGALDMLSFIDYCSSQGLDGAELTQYYFPEPVGQDFLMRVKRHAHLSGIDISGGAIGNNFTLQPGKDLDEQFKYTHAWIDHYANLGAPVIRVFAGTPRKGVRETEAVDRAVENLQKACEVAGKRGVMLAIENHDFTTTIDRLMAIIERVESPWFGVNFDSGNFSGSNDPYRDMRRIAPFAVNAQIKASIQSQDGKKRADLTRIVGILRDAGYSGYLALEYEERDDPYAAIPGYLEELRKLIA